MWTPITCRANCVLVKTKSIHLWKQWSHSSDSTIACWSIYGLILTKTVIFMNNRSNSLSCVHATMSYCNCTKSIRYHTSQCHYYTFLSCALTVIITGIVYINTTTFIIAAFSCTRYVFVNTSYSRFTVIRCAGITIKEIWFFNTNIFILPICILPPTFFPIFSLALLWMEFLIFCSHV